MKCKELLVKKDCCYIRFGKGEYDHSIDGDGIRLDFVTVKGDSIVIDFDKKNRIIGIELLGNKPCQKSYPKGKVK